MITLKEVTEWDSPNHIYMLNDAKDRLLAYVVNDQLRRLPRPLRFETKGRKFKQIPDTFGFTPDNEGKTWSVSGSNGNVYTVTEVDGLKKCSCSGHKFRGHCKHVEQVT